MCGRELQKLDATEKIYSLVDAEYPYLVGDTEQAHLLTVEGEENVPDKYGIFLPLFI